MDSHQKGIPRIPPGELKRRKNVSPPGRFSLVTFLIAIRQSSSLFSHRNACASIKFSCTACYSIQACFTVCFTRNTPKALILWVYSDLNGLIRLIGEDKSETIVNINNLIIS